MQRVLGWLVLLGAMWFAPISVLAQVGGPRLHLGAGLALDFAGGAELDDEPFDRDLDATFGVRGHADYAVHRHVSVGGMARMSWWEPDRYWNQLDIDRSFLFDLGPRVTGHYDWRNFRFYAGLSPGLTISAINEDHTRLIDNPAAGFTLSLTVLGMEWWFARKAGLFVELGWVGHWFEHDRAAANAADYEVNLSQGLLEFGFVFGV